MSQHLRLAERCSSFITFYFVCVKEQFFVRFIKMFHIWNCVTKTNTLGKVGRKLLFGIFSLFHVLGNSFLNRHYQRFFCVIIPILLYFLKQTSLLSKPQANRETSADMVKAPECLYICVAAVYKKRGRALIRWLQPVF